MGSRVRMARRINGITNNRVIWVLQNLSLALCHQHHQRADQNQKCIGNTYPVTALLNPQVTITDAISSSNTAVKWNFIILLEIKTLSLREVKWLTKATRLINDPTRTTN